MENQNPADLLAESFEKIKQAINVNIVMGEPLQTDFGMTVIPVSKVTYGFTSGREKGNSGKNGTGSVSGGFTMEPVAFLILQDGKVTIIHIDSTETSTAGSAMDKMPEMFDKVNELIKK